MLKTVNTEFSFIEIWFMDQDSRLLEIEDSVTISLIIGIGNFMGIINYIVLYDIESSLLDVEHIK